MSNPSSHEKFWQIPTDPKNLNKIRNKANKLLDKRYDTLTIFVENIWKCRALTQKGLTKEHSWGDFSSNGHIFPPVKRCAGQFYVISSEFLEKLCLNSFLQFWSNCWWHRVGSLCSQKTTEWKQWCIFWYQISVLNFHIGDQPVIINSDIFA